MEATLFPLIAEPETDADLEYYAPPAWFAEILMKRYFSRLGPSDLVLEPAVGSGNFLSAVPSDVPAFGVEIDPERAAQARLATGRPIITGDFRTVVIPGQPTAVISNPPFSLVAAFLDRAYKILPEGGIAGFLMPTHLLSYSPPSRITQSGGRYRSTRSRATSSDRSCIFRTASRFAQRIACGGSSG